MERSQFWYIGDGHHHSFIEVDDYHFDINVQAAELHPFGCHCKVEFEALSQSVSEDNELIIAGLRITGILIADEQGCIPERAIIEMQLPVIEHEAIQFDGLRYRKLRVNRRRFLAMQTPIVPVEQEERVARAIEAARRSDLVDTGHIPRHPRSRMTLSNGLTFSLRYDGEPDRPTTKPKACNGCTNYSGTTYGGNWLCCAIHPSGPSDRESCPDHDTRPVQAVEARRDARRCLQDWLDAAGIGVLQALLSSDDLAYLRRLVSASRETGLSEEKTLEIIRVVVQVLIQ